jgi:iron complex outermembrane receptor protein
MRRLISIFILICGVSRAQESGAELELLRLEDLMDIQVRAPSKLDLPVRDAPTVGTAVSREEVESYGWLSLNDILFKQPGFAPSQDYERLTVSSRGLHEGWNNNHLLLLIDGIPHNNNVNLTAYTWEITPLFMAQTMEVTRGSGSALYGSTAMNGIIAINTVSASNERPAEAMVRFGNAGTRIYDVMAGHEWKPLSILVAYNHFESEGNSYSSYDGSGRVDSAGRLMQLQTNDQRSSDYVFLKAEGNGKLRGLSLQFHYQYWTFGTGHGWLFQIPDKPEDMSTNVQILSLAYRPSLLSKKLQMEWVVMWKRQEVDYHARFYPAGTPGFPDGLNESLNNETNELFLRGQVGYRFWRDMTFLVGVENRLFVYRGDHSHDSNADLSSGGTMMPFPGNATYPLGPVLEPVVNRPVDNIGLYAQIDSGRFWKRRVQVTAGVRYDVDTFSYVDTDVAGRPESSQTFQQVSPRVALLIHPWRDLVFKAMFDRSFRAPAPTELFGANTYFISSDIDHTKPEELTAFTLAGDGRFFDHLNLRLDWYWRKNDNPIDFSADLPNLTTNLYSLTVTGIEAEALFDAPLTPRDVVSGFVNYSWTYQLDQEVHDVSISPSPSLAWYPAHVFNFGVAFKGHNLGISLQGHYQGRVDRRPSDSYNPDGSLSLFATYRPASVADWFTLDARLSYRLNDWLRLGVQGTNLTNTTGYLIKTNRYPFDYRIQGVRVLGTLEVAVKPR